MVWPHQPLFPYRFTLFRLGCAVGFAGAFLWPGLATDQRFLTLVAAFAGIGSGFLSYGILLLLLRAIPLLHSFFAFVLFYAALASAAMVLVEAAYAFVVRDHVYAAQRALEFGFSLCGSLGVLAAAYGAINRKVSSNNALERTRHG